MAHDAWTRSLKPGSFLGQTLRRFQADHLLLVESAYGPGFESPPHAHECAFFYLVLEGSCTQMCNGRQRTGSPSNLMFHPAGEVHSDCWHPHGGRCLHLEFDAHWIEQVREHSPILEKPAEFRGGTTIGLASRLYRELQAPDEISPLAIEGLALELVAHLARSATDSRRGGQPAWTERVKEFLRARFNEPLTLAEIACEAGVHPVHLVTAFRQHFQYTPFEYVRRMRVKFAADQLVCTDKALVEIALEAGFAHQSHFCRVFKAGTGMTPGAYRKLFAGRS